jgi:hypothetical protein
MCATPPRSAQVSHDAKWPWIEFFVCYLDKSLS